jgi:hypothetical protein
VTLTPAAEAHGLALALPESVGVARRAGAGHLAPTVTVTRIPILRGPAGADSPDKLRAV